MLAAESKVVAAGVADVPHAERDCSWKHIVEPVEPFLEAVNRRLARQVTEFDPNLAQYADYALNGHGKHLLLMNKDFDFFPLIPFFVQDMTAFVTISNCQPGEV